MHAYFLKYTKSSVVFLCIVFFLGGFLLDRLVTQPVIIRSKVLRESGYEYINPVLLCNTDNNRKDNEDTALSKTLAGYINSKSEDDISVYYLGLTTGKWASVNENLTFSPASMLKVPTVVEALKYAETNPGILSKKVYFDGSYDDNKAEYFKPVKSIEPGGSYTINDLLTYIIVNSDNNAVRLLHDNLKQAPSQDLYKDLGIDIPTNSLDFMSTKTYSLFLRVLYNSTYLTRESSEKLLGLMTTIDFPQGLEAGVPPTVEIANKFGERQIYTQDGVLAHRELHDCGIIYHQNGPYILCVMTRGQDFESLANSIKEISSIVYADVTK